MCLIAEFRLRGDPLLFGATFERTPGASCVFEDVHYVTDGDGGTHYVLFWLTSGVEFDAFERALGDDPTVGEFRSVADIGDKRLYRIVTVSFPTDRPLVFPTFREHDITAIESRRDADGLHLQARVPTRRTLRAFLDAAERMARTVEVARLFSEEPSASAEATLTGRQREALSVALDRGYFETPSEATLSELAEEFEVTPQTLSGHIRVGVKKLVERGVERRCEAPCQPGS